ncbi:MAG: hypothetical protein HYX27_05650 [Acidobacteria bacterium]|nr:hypothetical protein [Acidobacteriota bacterium]
MKPGLKVASGTFSGLIAGPDIPCQLLRQRSASKVIDPARGPMQIGSAAGETLLMAVSARVIAPVAVGSFHPGQSV